MSALVNCKACEKEIAKGVKKCVHCGKDQRNWFMRHKILSFISAVIIIGIIGSAAGGNEEDSQQASTEPKATETAAQSAETKTGEPKQEAPKELSKEGVSSDVTIKIGAVETKDTVGDEFSNEKAQGIFKIVEVSITNNQKDAITIDANSFKLVDDKGREFTYSTEGQTVLAMANGGNMDFFLKKLNPGLTQTGQIVFDVPQDATGLTMKARGGMMGKEIKLKVE